MDLSFTDEQNALRDLARQVFAGEHQPDELWSVLQRAGLADIRDSAGPIELCIVLQEAGREAAPLQAAQRLAGPGDLGTTGLCAFQTGICDGALRMTAGYSSSREQFGKPLGMFQAVQQRAADAYIDVEAMRWTMWQAAWRLAAGEPAGDGVAIAAYWATEGGGRVVAAAHHLHGGIGVDMEYPLHRYTLLAREVELALGGGWAQLAAIGDRLP